MISSHNHLSSIEIEAFRAGDKAVFKKFYYLFYGKLMAFMLRLVPDRDAAEELVQEVFVKIWGKRGLLHAGQPLENYLFSIARNLVFNKAKRRAYEFAYIRYLKDHNPAVGEETANKVHFNELQELVARIYDSLPPIRKQVFTLSRFEGRSNSEIADLLETSTSNVENHINKALLVFRKKFRQYDVDLYCLLFWYL